MPGVAEEMGGGYVSSTRGELTPFRYKVTGVPQGEDPRRVPGIPQEGQELEVDGETYFCDHVGVVECHNDTAGSFTIEALFTDTGRYRFSDWPGPEFRDWVLSYEKTTIDVPLYLLQTQTTKDRTGRNVDVLRWVMQERKIDQEHAVLNVVCPITGVVNNTQKKQLIYDAVRNSNCLNIFDPPGFPGDPNPPSGAKWLARSPTIKQVNATRIEISYSWTHDFGTPGMPVPPGINGEYVKLPPVRPGFHEYFVVPPKIDPVTLGTTSPKILVIDKYAPRIWVPNPDVPIESYEIDNPYYQPLGWMSLPGRPI